jgi:hypothetical protein
MAGRRAITPPSSRCVGLAVRTAIRYGPTNDPSHQLCCNDPWNPPFRPRIPPVLQADVLSKLPHKSPCRHRRAISLADTEMGLMMIPPERTTRGRS